MPWMCGKRIKYLRNGFTMLKMISEFDKRLISMGNDVFMWEIAEIFEKRLNMCQMTQICGKQIKCMLNGFSI